MYNCIQCNCMPCMCKLSYRYEDHLYYYNTLGTAPIATNKLSNGEFLEQLGKIWSRNPTIEFNEFIGEFIKPNFIFNKEECLKKLKNKMDTLDSKLFQEILDVQNQIDRSKIFLKEQTVRLASLEKQKADLEKQKVERKI